LFQKYPRLYYSEGKKFTYAQKDGKPDQSLNQKEKKTNHPYPLQPKFELFHFPRLSGIIQKHISQVIGSTNIVPIIPACFGDSRLPCNIS